MRNDLSAALPKFCLAVEEHRRTAEGRVRSSSEFLRHFFPYDERGVEDRIFKFLPKAVRGPIVTAWGIRGAKAALRDDDEKIRSVVHDALVAGDIDHAAFEQGVSSEVIMRWVPLQDWWAFWRGGKLTKNPIQKALTVAYELGLFDAKWFLETIQSRGGALTGTDVLAEGLTKEDLVEWVRRIRETGDGSPQGIVAALGWEKIVARTADDVLIAVLDAMALKVNLVEPKPAEAPAAEPPAEASAPHVNGTATAAAEMPAVAPDPFKDPVSVEWGKGTGADPNHVEVPPAAAVPLLPDPSPASGKDDEDIVVVDDELDSPTSSAFAAQESSGITLGLDLDSTKMPIRSSRPEPASPPLPKSRMR